MTRQLDTLYRQLDRAIAIGDRAAEIMLRARIAAAKAAVTRGS